MNDISGQITALSHIFYIQPKTHFVELSFHSEKINILTRNKAFFRICLNELSIRRWVKITGLKKAILFKGTNEEMVVWETTDKTTITEIEKQQVNPLSNNLINYEGEVTDDTHGASGLYMLDSKVLLCLSYMKLVTNIPPIAKGDTITIHNCHRCRKGDNILLLLCGRGLLINRSHVPQQNPYPPIKERDKEDFLQEFVLNFNVGFKLVYGMYQLMQKLNNHLQGILPSECVSRKLTNATQKGVLHCIMDHVCELFKKTPKSRSFSREFLHHGNGCTPLTKEDDMNIDYWSANSDEMETHCSARDLWENSQSLCGKGIGSRDKYVYWKHEMALVHSNAEQLSVVVGVLLYSGGRWQLRDSNGSIDCVLTDSGTSQEFLNRVIFATKFAVHREIFSSSGNSIQRIYLCLDEFHVGSSEISQSTVKYDNVSSDSSGHHVQFLLVNKSLPQMIHLTTPAKRDILGYLLVVSLLNCYEDNKQAKRPKMETNPDLCILVVTGEVLCSFYPRFSEGGIYELGLHREQLLKNRVLLNCLRDISQYELKSRTYLIPSDVSLNRVTCGFPKQPNCINGDIFNVEECLLLSELGEAVSLRGRIIDRYHVEPRFASEKSKRAFAILRDMWFGIPENKKIVLTLGSASKSTKDRTIDVYFHLNDGQIYPNGLYVGTVIELTWLVAHKTRNTRRLYCTSTALSSIRILRFGDQVQSNDARWEMTVSRRWNLGRRFLVELDTVIKTKEIFNCLVTVRYIHKVAISCLCLGCGSSVSRGTCSYVGCHWSGGNRIDVKAWCTVEDGSTQALMFINGESCRLWLKFPNSIWTTLVQHMLSTEGEFLYLGTKHRSGSLLHELLSLYFETSVTLRRPLYVTARKFGNSEANGHTAGAYYLKENASRKLFCMELGEMEAARCAMELSA